MFRRIGAAAARRGVRTVGWVMRAVTTMTIVVVGGCGGIAGGWDGVAGGWGGVASGWGGVASGWDGVASGWDGIHVDRGMVAPRVVVPGVDIAPTEGEWAWPTGSRVVLRPFEAPADDYGPGHRGLDVEATIGGPALAPADGVVAFAGPVAGRGVVTIAHGAGLVSTLDSVAPTVGAGDAVTRGQQVGVVTAGHCPASAPCLHLGARLDDRYVDPRPYLGVPAWPVLLPLR